MRRRVEAEPAERPGTAGEEEEPGLRPLRPGGWLRRRHHLAVILLALVATLWRAGDLDPLTTGIEHRLLDLRFRVRGPEAPPASVAIVAIDEATLAGFGSLAERRLALAEAVRRITAARPAALAVDILFIEESGADARLAAALADAGPVVLAAALVEGGAETGPMPEQRAALERSVFPVVLSGGPWRDRAPGTLMLPAPRFAGTGYLGHVNILRAPDRIARQLPLALPLGQGRFLPALPLTAAGLGLRQPPRRFALGLGSEVRVGPGRVATDGEGRITLNHLGPGGSVETVSLAALNAGRVPDGRLAGRVVFLGSTAPSLRDSFATPFASDVAGVEVLATATANLLSGSHLRRDLWAMLGSGALASLLGVLALRAGAVAAPGRAALALLAVPVLGLVVLQLAFATLALWLDAVAALAGAAIGGALSLYVRDRAGQSLTARLSAERRNLARYVSPVLAEKLAGEAVPDFDRRQHQAAVLFVDVASYTAMVETAEPVEVAAFLRLLHGAFEDTAARHGGVVVDFMGDGAMIVFGLPEPAAEDARAALGCGRDLIRLDLEGPGGQPVRLRVSVHYGPIAAAILGGRRQGQVSVTGDTVNIASRLQEVAKQAGADLVTTGDTLDAAGVAAARGYRRLGRDAMRGRRRELEIYAAASPEAPEPVSDASSGSAS